MKIRTGFVSNSSSSSFLIWGACVKTSELKLSKDFDRYGLSATYPIVQYHPDCDYCTYLGVSPSEADDNKTMAEFKRSTEQEVKKFLDEHGYEGEVKFGWYSEAWYDG